MEVMHQPSLSGEVRASMNCKICERKAKKHGLCAYHGRALAALRKGYGCWNAAYSHISWEEYLQRVKATEGTGGWVKEVIKMSEGGASVD